MNHHPHKHDDDGPWFGVFLALLFAAVLYSIFKIATK